MIRCPECNQWVSRGIPATGAVPPTDPDDNGSRDGYFIPPHWDRPARWWQRRRRSQRGVCGARLVWTDPGNEAPWRAYER